MRSGIRLLGATITTTATPACSRFCCLVGGQENGELRLLHPFKQFTIFGSGPAHFGDGADFIGG